MEAADLVLVTKADGNLLATAHHTKADYSGAMQFIMQKYPFWHSRVHLCSSVSGFQMDLVESEISAFHQLMCETRTIDRKRNQQKTFWMWGKLMRRMAQSIERSEAVQKRSEELTQQFVENSITPSHAATLLMEEYLRELKQS